MTIQCFPLHSILIFSRHFSQIFTLPFLHQILDPTTLMATNLFKSIYTSPRRRQLTSTNAAAATNSISFFLKPTTPATATASLSRATTFPISSATPATNISTSQKNTSFESLRQHLTVQDFRQADEETRRLLIAFAGEPAQKRGYVFFSEVQFIPESDLKTIDNLWMQYSGNKFGYSVQKKIWKKSNKDFTKFFIKVGWMKKLESSEVKQYNYRSFPAEYMWEIGENTEEGHLPLTNALRGTQLLSCILNHRAFEDDEKEEEDEEEESSIKPLGRTFKTSYSF